MANRAGKGVKSLFTIKLLYNVNDYASFLVHVCCASLSCGGIEKQGKSGYGFLCKHSFPCGQRKIQYLFCQHMTKKKRQPLVVSSFLVSPPQAAQPKGNSKCSGEVNSPSAKILLAQNACTAQKRRFYYLRDISLVTRHSARFFVSPPQAAQPKGNSNARAK